MVHLLPRILVTSSSFLDTPGEHRTMLAAAPFEVKEARGPLRAAELLKVIETQGPFDGILCGEDDFSSQVLARLAPRCRVISKYGVGLDQIDQDSAAKLGIAVKNTPGVSTTAVAELVFGLLLGLAREIPEHNRLVHSAQWQRRVGLELHGAVLGVVGLGQVGRAVVQRALAFGMRVLAFNSSWSAEHADFEARLQSGITSGLLGDSTGGFQRVKDVDSLLREADFVSLHVNLNRDTRKIIDARRLRLMKRSALLVNVSRGGLVDHQALARSLREGTIGGYAADVLEVEPVNAEEPLLNLPRVVLTPHIGSRTRTSVQRQGVAALQNLLQVLS